MSETPSSSTVDQQIAVANFADAGTPIGNVPVHISYGIIERFSEGLYSSPNKTFEELVTNSYDAGADTTWVYLSPDLNAASASLVVIDNGESMDLTGLSDLWRIGESKKRTDEAPKGRSKPVGKFGIGKLATYVLARELTYIVHKDEKYLAVTMDYGRVEGSSDLLDAVNLSLQVVELDAASATLAVANLVPSQGGGKSKALEYIEDKSNEHWTAAVLTKLKSTATNIQLGRLRWVLQTALPLNPEFRLLLNDEALVSSKASGKQVWSFTIGKDENQLVRSTDYPWGPGSAVQIENPYESVSKVPAYELPSAGIISGQATLFELPLERGKSTNLARSHGFFVRVRGRLINLDDEDFALGPELRHGTLTRFHMELNADDLDPQVASARESLRESPALRELKNYLLAVFNRARNVSAEQDHNDRLTLVAKDGRLADPPPGLTQGPLRRMLMRAVGGDTPIQNVLGFTEDSISEAEAALDTDDELIEKIFLEPVSSDGSLVSYDPKRRAVVVNQRHPFISNYLETKLVAEPLKLFGLTEFITQAFLLDENISPEIVERIMRRRDAFLRALTQRHPRSAHLIAQQLRDAANNEKALEDAVGDALEILGYQVMRKGGAHHGTDGIATARLGRRLEPRSDSYAFTYDAKSSGAEARTLILAEDGDISADVPKPGPPKKIRADTARTSILRVHRDRAEAKYALQVVPDFTLLVAPDFQGTDSEDGLINAVCMNDRITAVRVNDLARLVELFALQGLNPFDLRTFFDMRTPTQTSSWIETQSKLSRTPRPPISALVDVLVEFSESKRPTSKEALGAYLGTKGHDLDEAEVDALVRGLAALAPKSLYVDEGVVALNATPEALFHELRLSLDEFDHDLASSFRQTLGGDS